MQGRWERTPQTASLALCPHAGLVALTSGHGESSDVPGANRSSCSYSSAAAQAPLALDLAHGPHARAWRLSAALSAGRQRCNGMPEHVLDALLQRSSPHISSGNAACISASSAQLASLAGRHTSGCGAQSGVGGKRHLLTVLKFLDTGACGHAARHSSSGGSGSLMPHAACACGPQQVSSRSSHGHGGGAQGEHRQPGAAAAGVHAHAGSSGEFGQHTSRAAVQLQRAAPGRMQVAEDEELLDGEGEEGGMQKGSSPTQAHGRGAPLRAGCFIALNMQQAWQGSGAAARACGVNRGMHAVGAATCTSSPPAASSSSRQGGVAAQQAVATPGRRGAARQSVRAMLQHLPVQLPAGPWWLAAREADERAQ